MAGTRDAVPGRNEPDPLNVRQRSFQGGTDSLTNTDPPAIRPVSYGDVHGANPPADTTGTGGGAGLSGLPEADAGNVTPQWASPDAPHKHY